jgi:hypothetical protein
MRLPTTFYRHGYSRDRRGSNAGARSYFLLPIPGWEEKTCHYAHLTAHCFATDYPRGRIRQGPYSTVSGIRPYPTSLDPASTHHRSARKKSRRGTGLRVFSSSHPRRHHSVRGWPAIPEARRYSHLHRDQQNFTSRHPGVSVSSYPIKGQARALQGGQGARCQARSQVLASKGTQPEINISSNHPCTLSFPLRLGLGAFSHSL